MTPFERATAVFPPNHRDKLLADLKASGYSPDQLEEKIDKILEDELKAEIWLNDKYQVEVRRGIKPEGFPEVIWLSIKRRDKEAIHDWRDLQEIKNMLVGPEHEGFEIYPAESRLVDSANQYHLWVLADPKLRVPVGFDERFVSGKSFGTAKQRPFEEGAI